MVEQSRAATLGLIVTILTLVNCIPAMGDPAAEPAIEQRALAFTRAFQADFALEGGTQPVIEKCLSVLAQRDLLRTFGRTPRNAREEYDPFELELIDELYGPYARATSLVSTGGEPTAKGGILWTFVMQTASPGTCLDVHAADYGGELKIDNLSPPYPCRPGGFWGKDEMVSRAGAQRCAPAFEAVLRALRWRAEYRSTAAMAEVFAGAEVWLPYLPAPELVLTSSSRCTASSGLVRFRFAHTGGVPARWCHDFHVTNVEGRWRIERVHRRRPCR